LILRGFLEGKWMKLPHSYEEKGGCPNLFKGLALECWTCYALFMIMYFNKILLGLNSGNRRQSKCTQNYCITTKPHWTLTCSIDYYDLYDLQVMLFLLFH
jgi:hypothetical protein